MRMRCERCNGHGTEDGETDCASCGGSGSNPGFVVPTRCPMCNLAIDIYDECKTNRPFVAQDVLDGLNAWGAASMPKETVCYSGGKYIHFRTPGSGKPYERLVLMTEAA